MSSISVLTAGSTARPALRGGLINRILASLAAARSRRQLAALDRHLLADIGITRTAAQTEANRPVWDVPAHWMK